VGTEHDALLSEIGTTLLTLFYTYLCAVLNIDLGLDWMSTSGVRTALTFFVCDTALSARCQVYKAGLRTRVRGRNRARQAMHSD